MGEGAQTSTVCQAGGTVFHIRRPWDISYPPGRTLMMSLFARDDDAQKYSPICLIKRIMLKTEIWAK